MSRFVIRNDAGEEWPLDGERGVWFSNVQGLGIQNSQTMADLGNGFSHFLDTGTYPRVVVPGDLIFMPPNAYQTYRQLINFLMASAEFTLSYTPYGTDEYYRRVKIEYISKGVTDKRGRLDCPLSLIPLTPWYSPQEISFTMHGSDLNTMKYPFVYADDLVYGSDSDDDFGGTVNPGGHQPAALRLQYSGQLNQPYLTLTGATSGTEYARCAVGATVTGLDYSSDQRDSYVRDRAGNDLLDYVSMAYDPYIRIPLVGEQCILKLHASNTLDGTASVRLYYYFRSV